MSYLEHFNLTEQPFRLTPDPSFVYWSKQHARAKAYMESTIWLADGFVIITGDIGSGKTTLLQSFLTELDDDVVYAVVSQTQLSPKQFLQAILIEFGFKPYDKGKVELLDMLNMFLIEQYSQGKKVVLIIDEAQNLARKVLEEVRMLSGIETHKEKVLRIILAGQPELKEKIDSPGLEQLMQRVRLRFHLGPLDRREMQEYIEHRLAVAGNTNNELFEDEAYDAIFRYTGGVPRLVNTLCDTALLCAFADGKSALGVDDIMASINELGWQEYGAMTGTSPRLPRLNVKSGEAGHVMQFELRSKGKSLSVQSFPAGRVIVGRSPGNDIYIKSKFVSRQHAQLIGDDYGCVVEDLQSTNGMLIDDKPFKKRRLSDGDVIKLGIHELVYTDLRSSTDVEDTQNRAETAPYEAENDDDDLDPEETVVVGE
jgi:general secretion pathway protein A